MKEVLCDYCGQPAEYVDSKVVYGKSYGMMYLCRHCKAYVGVHRGTDIPLGRLADAELRRWKQDAHAAFDPLWQRGQFRGHRGDAYRWLAGQMGMPVERTHIGMMDADECRRVIDICQRQEGARVC